MRFGSFIVVSLCCCFVSSHTYCRTPCCGAGSSSVRTSPFFRLARNNQLDTSSFLHIGSIVLQEIQIFHRIGNIHQRQAIFQRHERRGWEQECHKITADTKEESEVGSVSWFFCFSSSSHSRATYRLEHVNTRTHTHTHNATHETATTTKSTHVEVQLVARWQP